MEANPTVTTFRIDQTGRTQALTVAWAVATRRWWQVFGRRAPVDDAYEVALRPSGASTPWRFYEARGTGFVTTLTGPPHTVARSYDVRVRPRHGAWSRVVTAAVTAHDEPDDVRASTPAPASDIADRIRSAAGLADRAESPWLAAPRAEQGAPDASATTDVASTVGASDRDAALTRSYEVVRALESRLTVGLTTALREAAALRPASHGFAP